MEIYVCLASQPVVALRVANVRAASYTRGLAGKLRQQYLRLGYLSG